MAVHAVYPSQRQSRADNPLFARELRRQRVAFMLLLMMLGLGLLALQLLPLSAHADNPSPQQRPVIRTKSPTIQTAQVNKPVREIQIYNLPAQQASDANCRPAIC